MGNEIFITLPRNLPRNLSISFENSGTSGIDMLSIYTWNQNW
jgi:hypothetical protein